MRQLRAILALPAAILVAGCGLFESGSRVFDVTGAFSIEHSAGFCIDGNGSYNMYCPMSYAIDPAQPFAAEVVTYEDRARIMMNGTEWGTGSVTTGPGGVWEVEVFEHGQSEGSLQRRILLEG